MAFLFALVLFLFSMVGCGGVDSSSSDDGSPTQSATTTVASSVDGEMSTTLNRTSEHTSTTTTEWKTTTQKTTEKTKTICPTRPPSPTTTTVRTTQPTVAPVSRLPEVKYFANDHNTYYTDIVNLKNGGYAVAGVKYTNDYMLSLIRIYDSNSQFENEYLFGDGNGYDKIACCINGGFVAASYNPPCLTKISSDFRVEWVAAYEDVALEGIVEDVEEIDSNCYAVLFSRTPSDDKTLKVTFLDGKGNVTESIELMKSIDISDGDIITDGNEGFYLVLTCNKELSSKYDLLKAKYDSSKGQEVVVMHFDADKKLTWAKTLGGGGKDWVEESATDSNGNFYIAIGTDWQQADSFWDMSFDRLSQYRRMLVKLNKNGDIVYRTPLSNKGMAVDQVFGIHIKDNKAYVVGMSDYFDGYQEKYPCEQISPSEKGKRIFCVYNVCIDGKGKELNRKVFRYYITDIPCDSVMLSNGSVVIGGSVSTIENPFNVKFPSGVDHMASLFIYE